MNNIKHILILLLLLSCNSSDNSDTNPPEEDNHIKYFGFSLVDVLWDDPTDNSTQTNYSNEVASFSNIADILVVEPTETIVDRLNLMSSLNMKAYIHLAFLFFEPNGTDAPSGTSYQLRSDYQERWNTFIDTNNLLANASLIQAFYIGEEPTWNGISFTDLKAATDYIKSTIPEVATLVIEAYPTLNDLHIPTSVDWIGFDHYFIKDPKNDTQFLSELATLKTKFSTEDQKLVFVMDTHYIESVHNDLANIQLEDMTAIATSYYDLALTEAKTIALIGYFWPSGFDDENAIGARHMLEETKAEYIRIGKEITGK